MKKIKTYFKKAERDPRNLTQLSSHLLSDLGKELQKEKVDCRHGCSHCCYLRVEAYAFEVNSIVHYVNTELNSKTRNLIKDALQKQFNVIRKMSEGEHLHTNVQCPLLVNGKCAVYPVRPVSCASYHSLDEQKCKKSYDDPYDDSFGIPQSPEIDLVKVTLHHFIQTELIAGKPSELISQLHAKLRG